MLTVNLIVRTHSSHIHRELNSRNSVSYSPWKSFKFLLQWRSQLLLLQLHLSLDRRSLRSLLRTSSKVHLFLFLAFSFGSNFRKISWIRIYGWWNWWFFAAAWRIGSTGLADQRSVPTAVAFGKLPLKKLVVRPVYAESERSNVVVPLGASAVSSSPGKSSYFGSSWHSNLIMEKFIYIYIYIYVYI